MKNIQFIYRLIIIFILGIQSYFACLGQDYNKIAPSSPQAYSFGQYVDVPVGYHTGVPEISVPIYTLSEGNAKVPITLSYHASGIKVEQEATWVGLGWTLNAGGMITRSKLGIADKIGGRGADPLLNRDKYSASDAYLYYGYMYSKSKDTQSDIFYYNFLGFSGKFTLDELGNPQLLETNNIKIIPIGIGSPLGGEDLGGWELIGEDGTKYFFGEAPNSAPAQTNFTEKFTNFDPNNSEGYTSGWHLREIQYVNGQKINFTYTSEYARSLSSMVKVMQEYWVYTVAGDTKDKYRNEDVGYSTKRLTSIEGENTKVVFDAGKLRSDLNSTNSYALTKVRILTKDDNLVKSFEFTSSYFQNSESDDYKLKRLRLDEIKELSTDGLTGQHWKFYYNTLMFPAKGSCAQDLFGYYNGQTGNTSLVPKINETVSPSEYNPGWIYSCGYDGLSAKVVNVGEANREPDENSMKACNIDSIVYPTGGSTKYVFEPNSYNFIGNKEITSTKIGGGLRIKEIRNYYADKSYLKTTYTYKMLDTDGATETSKSSGVLNNNPRFYNFRANYVLEQGSCPMGDWKAPILAVTATPAYRLALTHGSPVGYRQVKVQKVSGTANNGCEVYEYTSSFEYPDIFRYSAPGYATYAGIISNEYSYGYGMSKWDWYLCNISVMYGDISYEAKRGLLNKKSDYNSSNVLVNSTTYSYLSQSTFLYNNYCGIQKALSELVDDGGVCHHREYGYSFVIAPVNNCTNQLTGVDNYDYLNGGTVYSHKDYTYGHNQIIKEVSTDSKGNDIIKKYKYPLDYADGVDPVIDNLKSDNVHILSPVIEEQKWSKQDNSYNLTSGNITTYGSNYMPQKIYSLNTVTSLSSTLFGEDFNSTSPYQQLFADNNRYYEEKAELFYTPDGNKKNICEVLKKDDVRTSYIWGYNQTLPIINAENISATALTTAVNTANSNLETLLTSVGDMNTAAQKSVWKSFNTSLRGALPANAMVTTYTYKPLIGMTSSTDPNGVTMYYEYDTFGRLKLIKDDDGRILKTYEYNYKQ